MKKTILFFLIAILLLVQSKITLKKHRDYILDVTDAKQNECWRVCARNGGVNMFKRRTSIGAKYDCCKRGKVVGITETITSQGRYTSIGTCLEPVDVGSCSG